MPQTDTSLGFSGVLDILETEKKKYYAGPAEKLFGGGGGAARIGPQNVVRCEDTLHEIKKCPEGVLAELSSQPVWNSL